MSYTTLKDDEKPIFSSSPSQRATRGCDFTQTCSLEEIEMVVQGIIRPPPEIRAVADRTALYVAKNGRTFETRILNSSKGQTPKFAFLHATSPFHAYYEDRIQFYEQNGGVEEEKTDTTSNVDPKSAEGNPTTAASSTVEGTKNAKSQKSSALDPVAKALLSQRTRIAEFYKQNADSAPAPVDTHLSGIEGSTEPLPAPTVHLPPPPTLSLVQIVAPASISPLQLETIQFTAQLIALASVYGHGVNLLQELVMREWNNRTFAFCQPRHGHFAYFSALVDAYQGILHQWSLPSNITSEKLSGSLEVMANNVEHCLDIAAYRAEYQRDKEERSQREQDVPTVTKIDWHDFVVVETIDFPVDEVIAMLPPPQPPSLAPTQLVKAVTPQSARLSNGSDMEEEDEEDEETIRVVPTYTPKIATSDAANPVDTMVVDPISGKSVAVKDMPEHMRIQLLDPKWAEERKKFQDKQKESNLVSGDMVAANLERFAQARGDRFGKKVRRMKQQGLLSMFDDDLIFLF
jgi:splicing factor 3A subunit 1